MLSMADTRRQCRSSFTSAVDTRSSAVCQSPHSRYAVRRSLSSRALTYSRYAAVSVTPAHPRRRSCLSDGGDGLGGCPDVRSASLAADEPDRSAGDDRYEEEGGDDRGDGKFRRAVRRRRVGARRRGRMQRGNVLGERVDQVHDAIAVLVVPAGWTLVDGGGGQPVHDLFAGEVRKAGTYERGCASDDGGGVTGSVADAVAAALVGGDDVDGWRCQDEFFAGHGEFRAVAIAVHAAGCDNSRKGCGKFDDRRPFRPVAGAGNDHNSCRKSRFHGFALLDRTHATLRNTDDLRALAHRIADAGDK